MTTTLTLLKFLLKLGIEIIEKMVERLSSGNLQRTIEEKSETEYHIKLTLHLACGPLKAYC
jgi:hypothetical protein